MTKEERIERLEKELAELKEEIAAEKTGKGPWKPECGSLFYRATDTGSVGIKRWEDTTCGDEWRWQIGNVFQTEEEAKRMVCRLKARKKFLDTGGHEGVERYFDLQPPIKPVWHIYPTGYGCLRTEKKSGVTAFDIWFESEDDVQKAIDSLTDDEKAALCWIGKER